MLIPESRFEMRSSSTIQITVPRMHCQFLSLNGMVTVQGAIRTAQSGDSTQSGHQGPSTCNQLTEAAHDVSANIDNDIH